MVMICTSKLNAAPKSIFDFFSRNLGKDVFIVEFNWFKRRISYAFNSRIEFGTYEMQRLNGSKAQF